MLFINGDSFTKHYTDYFSAMDPTINIEELKPPGFTIFPNPSSGYFSITSEIDIENLEIINPLGEIIQQYQPHSNFQIVDVKGVLTGMYYLRVSNQNGISTEKIIINN